jgi:hypothetical protein
MKNTSFVMRLRASLSGLALVLLTVAPAFAQTALTATTLAAAVTDTGGQNVSVTSATGITAPGTGGTFVLLLVDKELMGVRAINSTNISVQRGQNGTRAATHTILAPVTVVPPQAVFNYVPSGQCTRTTLLYVPMVVGGQIDQSLNGTTLDCLGLTTAGQWASTNNTSVIPSQIGSTMASTAGTLGAFTGTVVTISGTNAITGFTNPAGVGVGWVIQIVPSGVFTWTAAGNIALAGTAVVNKLLTFTWSGTKWVPNYIA